MTPTIHRKTAQCNFNSIAICIAFLLLTAQQCSAGYETSIFQESVSQTPPPSCLNRFYPTYNVLELNGFYKLVIDVPEVHPKNLNVDVDYSAALIRVLGWIDDSGGTSGVESNTNACIYQEWTVRAKSEDIHVNIQDLVMKLKDGELIISIPMVMSRETNKLNGAKERILLEDDTKRVVPLRVATEGKKLRGLARISRSRNETSFERIHDEKRNSTDKLAAQKFEQKIALEKFLAVSLTDTDEEAYLLHKI